MPPIAWTEAVTKISDRHVPDEVYEEARRNFSEKELVDLTAAVIAINAWNRPRLRFCHAAVDKRENRGVIDNRIPKTGDTRARPRRDTTSVRHGQAARNLTLVYAAGQGGGDRGLNHFAHLASSSVIGATGDWYRSCNNLRFPTRSKRTICRKASSPTCSVISRRPGHITKVGIGAFVNSRNGGGKLNARTTEDRLHFRLHQGLGKISLVSRTRVETVTPGDER